MVSAIYPNKIINVMAWFLSSVIKKNDKPKIKTRVGILTKIGYKKNSPIPFAESPLINEKLIPRIRIIKLRIRKTDNIPSALPTIYCALVMERA